MQIDLVEFSVVVVAQSNNPTILNPDFLRHNGIVSSDRALHDEQPLFTTPMFSQVAFADGLVIQADPARITFAQTGGRLSCEEIDCPVVAKGYLKTIPHVPYTALGLNPKVVVRNPPFTRLSNMLSAEGDRMTFGSCLPRFEIKATYQLPGRRLALTLQEVETGQGDALICAGNIHRDVEETNQQMGVNSILSMLDCWREDLDEFSAVVNQVLQWEDGNVR